MAGLVLCKPGVDLTDMAPAGVLILAALKTTARALQLDLTVTAGRNGKHAPTSAHYTGEAIDVRSKDVAPELKPRVLASVRAILGPQFYGLLEASGKPHEHYHVQRKRATVLDLPTWLAT